MYSSIYRYKSLLPIILAPCLHHPLAHSSVSYYRSRFTCKDHPL